MDIQSVATAYAPATNSIMDIIVKTGMIVILIVVGLIVAAIAKSLILKILKMEKVNEFFKKIDSKEVEAGSDLTFVNLIAKLVYWLVILIFLMPILGLLGLNSLSNSIGTILGSFVDIIPAIIYAVIIVAVGFFIAKIVKEILYIVLYKARVNELVQKVTFEVKEAKSLNIAKILSVMTYILILILFITQALDILQLDVLTNVSIFVIGLIPSVIAAVFIFIGAYILGSFLEGIIVRTFNSEGFSKILGLIIKYFVWVMGIGIVLNQIGLDIMLINVTYIVLLISVGVALAIAFGVGGIETAKKLIEKNVDKLEK